MPVTPVRYLMTAILLGGGAVGLVSTSSSPASMSVLAALEPIDTHAHAYQAVPGLADLLTRLHLRILNVPTSTRNGRAKRSSSRRETACWSCIRT